MHPSYYQCYIIQGNSVADVRNQVNGFLKNFDLDEFKEISMNVTDDPHGSKCYIATIVYIHRVSN